MEKTKAISDKFKSIMKNKGIKQDKLASVMGVTKQAVGWVLNHRLDKDWSDKEVDYWCKSIKTDSKKIYELRDLIYAKVKESC